MKDENLKSYFNNLQEIQHHAPEEIKTAVFTHLDSIELFSDIFELFTIGFVSTEAQIIDQINKKKDK